jgi:hypothetical protein
LPDEAPDKTGISENVLFFPEAEKSQEGVCHGVFLYQLRLHLITHHTLWITSGFLSQNLERWITAHVNAYQFFSGATRLLIPDNLKTGVEKAHLVLAGHQQDLPRNG